MASLSSNNLNLGSVTAFFDHPITNNHASVIDYMKRNYIDRVLIEIQPTTIS